MRVFMAILCSLLAVCSVSARDSRRKGTDRQAAIYRLPPFERAVRCTKYFEGWHSEKHHPYVGWGHQVQPGERYSARTMTKRQADALLRKDLRKFCAMFRKFGRDSLLLATLAYNVGPYRLLGSGMCAFGATCVEVVLLQAHRVTVLGGVLHATLYAPWFGTLSRQGGEQGE